MNDIIKNFSKHIIWLVGIFTFLILISTVIFVGKINNSLEYSFYKLTLNVMTRNENKIENISSKCTVEIDSSDEQDEFDKLLITIFGNSEPPSCLSFLESTNSLTGNILSEMLYRDINFKTKNAILVYKGGIKQKVRLFNFITKKETNFGESNYGFSYKCADVEDGEKVCSIFNNDDSYEDLYFKKINSKWVLVKIKQYAI